MIRIRHKKRLIIKLFSDFIPALKFVLDWSVTSKIIKKLYIVLYADDDILFFDEDLLWYTIFWSF